MAIIPTPEKPRQRKHTMSESAIQISCVQWLHNSHPETRGLFFCVPNENSRSGYENKRQQQISGSIRKNMGVQSGVSDTILMLPRGSYHALCCEFKTEKGVQSPSQCEWQQRVESVGYKYIVVRSLEQFKQEMENYLAL